MNIFVWKLSKIAAQKKVFFLTFFGLLRLSVFFKGFFAPTSWSRMSNIFKDSEFLGKSNGKKWSNIWTFLFGSGRAKKKVFFADFALVHLPMALVLLSASVERCFVSRMRDFFVILLKNSVFFLQNVIIHKDNILEYTEKKLRDKRRGVGQTLTGLTKEEGTFFLGPHCYQGVGWSVINRGYPI